MRRFSRVPLAVGLFTPFLIAGPGGQPRSGSATLLVKITQAADAPVAYALVTIGNGTTRVAGADGIAVFPETKADSVRVTARRIGFKPSTGMYPVPPGEAVIRIQMEPLVTSLDTIRIVASDQTPLARTGFYDRIARVQRGAFTARFFTPEELEQRNPSRVSQVLYGESTIRVTPDGRGRVVLLGRGPNCAMTVLLDGRRVSGTVEESINNPSLGRNDPRNLMTVDELVPAGSVAAIEVYGSAASAPVELVQVAGRSGCGIIAIWTGAKR